MAETGKRKDAFGAYYFRVDLLVGGDSKYSDSASLPFRSCSGLKSESQVVSIEEGGFNTTTRKLIGRTSYPNIVLKQGMCSSTSLLWKLRQSFLNDSPQQAASKAELSKNGRQTPNRFSGVITQMGPDGAAAKWVFSSAWVCKWEGPDFDASKNEISIESIEIAHEGLMMLPPPGAAKNDQQAAATTTTAKPASPPPPAAADAVDHDNDRLVDRDNDDDLNSPAASGTAASADSAKSSASGAAASADSAKSSAAASADSAKSSASGATSSASGAASSAKSSVDKAKDAESSAASKVSATTDSAKSAAAGAVPQEAKDAKAAADSTKATVQQTKSDVKSTADTAQSTKSDVQGTANAVTHPDNPVDLVKK